MTEGEGSANSLTVFLFFYAIAGYVFLNRFRLLKQFISTTDTLLYIYAVTAAIPLLFLVNWIAKTDFSARSLLSWKLPWLRFRHCSPIAIPHSNTHA